MTTKMTTTMTEQSSQGVQVFDGLPRLPVLPFNARDVEVETREAPSGTGFSVKPGVYVREMDFSSYAPKLDGLNVIGADNPVDKFEPKVQAPVEVKSSEELHRIFGTPGSPSPQG